MGKRLRTATIRAFTLFMLAAFVRLTIFSNDWLTKPIFFTEHESLKLLLNPALRGEDCLASGGRIVVQLASMAELLLVSGIGDSTAQRLLEGVRLLPASFSAEPESEPASCDFSGLTNQELLSTAGAIESISGLSFKQSLKLSAGISVQAKAP